MSVTEQIAPYKFNLFLDEKLRQSACQAVELFLNDFEPVDHVQLHSIQSVIQGGGRPALKDLIENNKNRNTKEKNKKFWGFVFELVLAIPGPDFSFRKLIQEQLNDWNLLQDETKETERTQQKKVRKENKAKIEEVMNEALRIYFEHFNCHYFFMTNVKSASGQGEAR